MCESKLKISMCSMYPGGVRAFACAPVSRNFRFELVVEASAYFGHRISEVYCYCSYVLSWDEEVGGAPAALYEVHSVWQESDSS